MGPIRRAIDAAILALIIKPLIASMRRSAMDQARATIGVRARAVLPPNLLESPAIMALAARVAPPPPPARDRRDILRGLLIAAVVAVTATTLAFLVAAMLRSRRRSRVPVATTAGSGPVVIPVSPAAGTEPTRARGEAEDALQAIDSIGPEISERLRGIGIVSIAQIAAWSPEDIERIARELEVSADRIRREDWVTKAQAQLAGSAAADTD